MNTIAANSAPARAVMRIKRMTSKVVESMSVSNERCILQWFAMQKCLWERLNENDNRSRYVLPIKLDYSSNYLNRKVRQSSEKIRSTER